MNKKAETTLIFLLLILFLIITIYPLLNIVSISLRTDNAFQSRSLSIIEYAEKYDDLNNNAKWDADEPYIDLNENGFWDSGSSVKSYITLFTQTDFFLWCRNSILISFIVTITGIIFASTGGYALSRFKFIGREF